MRFPTLLSIAALSALIACGGSEPAPAPAKPAAKTEAPAAPKMEKAKTKAPAKVTAPSVVTDDGTTATIALEGTDTMKFNTARIEVVAGRKVKLTLTHVGKLPKEAMGHNFVLLKPGTDMAAFSSAAIAEAANSYIPQDQKDVVIAYTTVVGGGESVTIEFDAPAAGEYDFICSFPGHYAMMKGKFVVVEA